jgi:uncharacterized lipoprotein YbaY
VGRFDPQESWPSGLKNVMCVVVLLDTTRVAPDVNLFRARDLPFVKRPSVRGSGSYRARIARSQAA